MIVKRKIISGFGYYLLLKCQFGGMFVCDLFATIFSIRLICEFHNQLTTDQKKKNEKDVQQLFEMNTELSVSGVLHKFFFSLFL